MKQIWASCTEGTLLRQPDPIICQFDINHELVHGDAKLCKLEVTSCRTAKLFRRSYHPL